MARPTSVICEVHNHSCMKSLKCASWDICRLGVLAPVLLYHTQAHLCMYDLRSCHRAAITAYRSAKLVLSTYSKPCTFETLYIVPTPRHSITSTCFVTFYCTAKWLRYCCCCSVSSSSCRILQVRTVTG
jgi:hypothetical protein